MSYGRRQWLGRSQRLRAVFYDGLSPYFQNRPLGGNTTTATDRIVQGLSGTPIDRTSIRGFGALARVMLGNVTAAVPALRAFIRNSAGAWQPGTSGADQYSFDFERGSHFGAATYINKFGLSAQSTSADIVEFGNGFRIQETDESPSAMSGLVCFLGKTSEGYGSRWIQVTAVRLSKPKSVFGARTGISRALPLGGESQGLPQSFSGLAPTGELVGEDTGELFLIRVSEIADGTKTVKAACLFWGEFELDNLPNTLARVSLARHQSNTYCTVQLLSSTVRQDFVLGVNTIVFARAHRFSHSMSFLYSPASEDECLFGEFRSSVLRGTMFAGTTTPDSINEQSLELRDVDHDHVSDVGFRHGVLTLPAPAFFGLRESWQYSQQNEKLILPNIRGLFGESVQTDAEQFGELTRSTAMFQWQGTGSSSIKVPAEMQAANAVTLTTRVHEFEEGMLCDAFQFANVTPPQLTLSDRQVNGVALRFILTGTGTYTGFSTNSQSGFFATENRTVPSGELTESQAAEIVADTQFGSDQGFVHPVGEYECEAFSINGVESCAGLFYGTKTQGTFTFEYGGTDPFDQSSTIQRTVVVRGDCEFYAIVGVGLQAPGVITPESAADSRADSPDAHRGRVQPCVVTVGGDQSRTSLRIDIYFRSVSEVTVTDTETPANTTTTNETDGANEDYAKYLGTVFLSADQVESLLADEEVIATKWIEGLNDPDKFALTNPYNFGGNVLASPPEFKVGVAVRFL